MTKHAAKVVTNLAYRKKEPSAMHVVIDSPKTAKTIAGGSFHSQWSKLRECLFAQ